MGKSSGGGSQPTGSQTVTQDIAEPFKGFITRSLQRAEDLQGLPSLPFTGIATAPPTPDELVGAQSLRNRFMEHQPLTEQAIALQTTAADPITAQGILARQNPFQAQIAQEAYRRLDENTQRDLQDQRAREVNSGGFRARGAIEDHLLRQRQQDQERQIGLEAGNRAFTEASKLAIADRDARGTTAAGINQRLQERQNLGRVDIDDILRVGAQQRETFIQPEINLERQQFQEQRGPGSMQNPFGFEQFFSGIRSAAPSPTVSTQQQFKQGSSGLATAANVVGGGLTAANNFGAFNSAKAEGGIINFDQGGIAQFADGKMATLAETRTIKGEIARLAEFFASFKREPGNATPEQIQSMEDVAKAFHENRGELDIPGLEALTKEVNRIAVAARKETLLDQAPQSRETGRSDFDAMVDTHSQLAKGFTDVQQPESKSAQEQPRGYGLLGSGDKPRGMITENRALERLAAQERVSGIEAAALARAEEEMGNRVVSPQTLKEAGQRRFDEARMDQQDWLGGERERTKTLSDPQASQWGVEKSRPFGYGLQGSGEKPRGTLTEEGTRGRAADLERRAAEFEKRQSSPPVQTSEPELGFLDSVDMKKQPNSPAPQTSPHFQEAPEEYWAESLEGLPDRMAEMIEGRAPYNELAEMIEGRAVSPEPERKYSDAEITAMMTFSSTGRGREGLPDGLKSLDTFEVHEALKPIRERAAKASKARREKERRDRISNRSGFRNSGNSPEASYEFGIQDVKDLFDFKDGGIASFASGREVEVQGEMEKALRRYNPALMYGYSDKFKADRDVALGRIPSYPSRTEELTDVAEEMVDYDYDFEEGKAAGATEVAKARKKVAKLVAAANNTPTPTTTEGAEEVPYMEQIMKTYMDSLKPSETKGYPSKPKLTDEQTLSGAIASAAAALMSVSSDEAGNADFSRMGSAAAASSSKTLADLEAARKEEVAAASARSSSILTGLMANTKMAQEMSESQLNTVNAALKQQELLHPEWRVQKIAYTALLPLVANQMITQEKMNEIMLGLTGSNSDAQAGLNLPGTDANVNAALDAALK
jgi:hypothetical protein